MPTVAPKSNRTNRRRTGRAEYLAMVEAHRAEPGCHKKAAEAAGVSYNTARKSFRFGLAPDMPAISVVLEREKAEVRHLLEREGVAEKDRQERAVRAVVAEGVERRIASARIVALAQSNTLAALKLSKRLLGEARSLAERFERGVRDSSWEPSPGELLELLDGISKISRESAAAFAEVLALDLEVVGEGPAGAARTMTVDEAICALRAGERTLARIRRQALLHEGSEPAP